MNVNVIVDEKLLIGPKIKPLGNSEFKWEVECRHVLNLDLLLSFQKKKKKTHLSQKHKLYKIMNLII